MKEWRLELKYRPAMDHVLTYQNLGVVFTITKFKPLLHEKITKMNFNILENPYLKDDMLRHFIGTFKHKQIKEYTMNEFKDSMDFESSFLSADFNIMKIPDTQDEEPNDF